MLRPTALTLCLLLPATVLAASLKDYELTRMLEKVAKESSIGTPRAINEDILDQGYTVEGNELINHLSVRTSHAQQMRAHPDAVRNQLLGSVCSNRGFRQLLGQGAVLRYQFSEYQSNRPVTTERYRAADCNL
ncbi:quorum-sensing-regulated virulence factor family protein [Azorhizophilus paspali]|uniref:Quorum-sensing-regulated virulence factor family protein n=1 Tax=Azorhizophilus paspali TaxID=69963 RepID=A0ABV6SKT4_AZOPA